MFLFQELLKVTQTRQSELIARQHWIHWLMQPAKGFAGATLSRFGGNPSDYLVLRTWDDEKSFTEVRDEAAMLRVLVKRGEDPIANRREVEAKQAMVKKWDRELENRSEPLVKQVDQFQSFVTAEMPKAIAYLTQVIRALEAYTEVRMSGSTDATVPEPIEPLPTDSAAPETPKEGQP